VGSRDALIAVADAGPLIHLAEVDALDLLRIFETLHLPAAVWREAVAYGRVRETALLDLGNLQRLNVPQAKVSLFAQEHGLGSLQAGELESLCLCQELGVLLLLTDDLAVRDAAKHLSVQPVGSLGIVVRAYHTRKIVRNVAERLLLGLYETSSLFVTRTIVELAIEQLGSRARDQ